MDAHADAKESVDLTATALVLLRAWWIILGVAALCAGAGLISALLYPKHYEASISLVPVTSQSVTDRLTSIGSSLGGLGGLMSLAGMSSSESSSRAEALATLQSGILTETYIKQQNLLPVLFRKRWDVRHGRWLSSRPDEIPTLWKANRLFEKKIRKVSDDARSGIVTLSITWTDPRLAAQWANGLVEMTNDYLRAAAIVESDRSIAYLNHQISQTNVVELRAALYELMEDEIKKEMLAKGTNEYAFKVVDPAVPPEIASYPRPILWTALAAFAGAFAAAVVVLYRRRLL